MVFLRFVKRRSGSRIAEYAQIAEKDYADGKQKTRVIKHLGPVNDSSDRERYKALFKQYMDRERAKESDISRMKLGDPKEFGIIYASREIFVKTGIFGSLGILGRYRELAFFMVAGRLIEPGSDVSLVELASRTYYPWAALKILKDDPYRCLDNMLKARERIEIGVFRKLHPDTTRVYYDLTSTYFEGREENDLVMFGYSRDKKRGKEQIVIGLVMADGLPIHHEVWSGNTVDPKTLEPTIEYMEDKFHVKEIIYVEDRAFGRKKSLSFLDTKKYITAAYRWDQPYRSVIMETRLQDSDLHDDLYLREVSVKIATDRMTKDEKERAEKRRYILVLNKEREKSDILEYSGKVREALSIMRIHGMKEGRKRLRKLKSFLIFSEDSYHVNMKKLRILRKIAGRFLLITNTSLPPKEVVEKYKDLWRIERSFRTMKSFLEIRPVGHWRSDRIRSHVFVCVLSLLLSRLMEKRLVSGLTAESACRTLSEMKAVPVTLPGMSLTFRSEGDNATRVLKEMGIEPPDRLLDGALPKSG